MFEISLKNEESPVHIESFYRKYNHQSFNARQNVISLDNQPRDVNLNPRDTDFAAMKLGQLRRGDHLSAKKDPTRGIIQNDGILFSGEWGM